MNDTSVVMISWSPDEYRLKVLRQCFASLKAHTKRDHTLVVVDNGVNGQKEFLEDQDIDILIRPKVNLGVGMSRKVGVGATDSKYVAVVDNDIGFFPGWLDACIGALERYPDRKLVATAVKTHPMKYARHKEGMLDEYELWRRCAGMCLVMRRSDYDILSKFNPTATNVGHRFCLNVRNKGYHFIWHPSWTGRHLSKTASFHYKKQWFNKETGTWHNKESNHGQK